MIATAWWGGIAVVALFWVAFMFWALVMSEDDRDGK